jgi:predicted unusual protein kinase regulating ubiquinone biosynthesis (AarF/ABC1/UbiB family)
MNNLRLVKRGGEIARYAARTYRNVRRIQRGGPDSNRAAEEFVKDTSNIGVIAIKMSQFLSARGDIFDERVLRIIEKFQNEVPENELPALPDYTFYKWDPSPLASASVATVYKGIRTTDNKDVVLKRIRPGVKDRITEDLPLFMIVLEVSKFFGVAGAENMLEIVRECRPMLLAELDLRTEAKTTSMFKNKFSYLSWLTIPSVYEAGEQYMISEYVPSRKITDAHPNTMLAERLFELYIRMIVDIGLVHADPHAGNIGVKSDGSFVLYDFGAVIDVRDIQRNIAACLRSAIVEDADGVVRALENMGIVKPGGNGERLRRIVPKIKNMMETSKDFNTDLGKLPEFADNDNRLFELTTTYIYLIRSLTIVEGIVKYHDSNFSLNDYVKKYDEFIDELLDVPVFDIVQNIGTDFLGTPSSLKNLNDLVFSMKTELRTNAAETKQTLKYATFLFILLELKMLFT